MSARTFPSERLLAHVWETQAFAAVSLRAIDGQAVEILWRGRKNLDAGPDFLDALIRIGGRLRDGDVELHVRSSDWRAHGHERDPHYARVILHVVIDADGAPVRINGEDVPTLAVAPLLAAPIDRLREQFEQAEAERVRRLEACQASLRRVPVDDLLAKLKTFGKIRLLERARRFGKWLPQASFQQMLYQAICEGLGYSSNKQAFLELACRLPLDAIAAHLPDADAPLAPERMLWIQAALFGAAGLLPDAPRRSNTCPALAREIDAETEAHLARLREAWNAMRPALGVAPMTPDQWRFFRMRPANFPTRRLAVLSELIARYIAQPPLEHYLKLFTMPADVAPRAQAVALFERTLEIPVSGYWKGRMLFGRPRAPERDRFFFGASRIRDMLISAVMPVCLLCAQHQAQPDIEAQIFAWLAVLPSPLPNAVSRRMTAHLFGQRAIPPRRIRRADVYQGMLHLDRRYCSLSACQQCLCYAQSRQTP